MFRGSIPPFAEGILACWIEGWSGFFAMIGLGYIISPAGCDILSDTCDIMPSGASALLQQYGGSPYRRDDDEKRWILYACKSSLRG